MAKSFGITTTAGEIVKADARGHAEAVFTVTNVTARPVRGLAKVRALGDTRKEWLAVNGETERDFATGATQQFTVNFDAGANATSGKYPFRLDIVSSLNPDEDFTEGTTVTVEVSSAPAPTPIKRMNPLVWIIPVAAVVLIAIGITAWLLLRTKKVTVPDVVDKPVAEATNILADGKLTSSVRETKVTNKVAEGRVAEQSPAAGSEVAENSAVELVVEAAHPTPTPTPVATQRVNAALGKATTQSSIGFGGLPARAVDGNTSGNWSDNSVTHTNSEANAWWQVDLGAAHSIAQIKVWNRTDCCPERLANFYVFVSNAPFASNDLNSTISQPGVFAFQAPSQAGTPTTITVGKTGRYVRIQLVGANFLSLAEVQVMADVTASAQSNEAGKRQPILARDFLPHGRSDWTLAFASVNGPTTTSRTVITPALILAPASLKI
ncbi:MAG: hypothetical protein QOJ88_978 [Pyrinomonadaceae bacterium]|nr:hypothetical protein [Pyrinomonadaceae bacterium]